MTSAAQTHDFALAEVELPGVLVVAVDQWHPDQAYAAELARRGFVTCLRRQSRSVQLISSQPRSCQG